MGSALLLAPLLVFCVLFLDAPLALYVKTHFYGNRHWSRLTADLPDLLLVVVLVTTCIAFTLYLLRSRKGIYDVATSLDRLLAWVAPASYLAKNVLKFVFGRVNTRDWLQHPGDYGFHWLRGGQGWEGFPSGHMLVVVTILAAVARFYPRSRPLCLLVASLLGLALIATDYHFLSDVIAGAWAGMLLETAVFHLLFRDSRRLENSAS